MKPKKLKEIWEAEVYYDEIRWSSEQPLKEFDLEALRELRSDVSETISALTSWLSRKLRPENRERVKRIKMKLIDFRWSLIREIQRQERKTKHFERLEHVLEPKPRIPGLLLVPAYGLSGPLKGSGFYKGISRAFAPRPKGGKLS